MVAKVSVRVRGGDKLRQFLRDKQRAVAEHPGHKVEVGFDDLRVAPLAARLEFGDARFNLPPRPAFRDALPDMYKVAGEVAAREIRRAGGVLDYAGAVAVALAARDVVRDSYLNFKGPGLSERQAARKAGTRGAGKELIGSEGPKLISRIHGFVDGKQV